MCIAKLKIKSAPKCFRNANIIFPMTNLYLYAKPAQVAHNIHTQL